MENNLKSFLNAFQDLVFILDEKGIFLEYLGNEESPDLLLKKKDFLGKHYHEVLPPHISQEADHVFNNPTLSDYRFEYSLPFSEGLRWFSAILSRFTNDGKPQMLLVARNITLAKQQELLTEGILNSSVSGIVACTALRDSQGKVKDFAITKVNKAAEKIVGLADDESLGKSFLEISPAIQSSGLFDRLVDTLETGEILDVEQFFQNGRLGPTWYHVVASKMGDGLVLSFENINIRKEAEEKLRQNEATQKLLTENMMDMVALHEPDGTYVYISPSVEKLLGYTPEDLIGKNPYHLFHPDDHQKIREASHEPILEGQESVTDIQYRIQTKSGKYIWFETSTKAILDENGKLVKLQTISRNITRRKSLQLELTEAYNNFQTIFNASTAVGFIATDHQGIIKSFNAGAEKILGYTADEVVNNHTPVLFHLPEEVEKNAEVVSQELGQKVLGFETFTAKAKLGHFEEREWTYVHKDGHHIQVNLAITAIRNLGGDITGYLGVVYDITQRKLTEEAIKASEKKYRTIFQNIRDIFFRTDREGIVTEISPSITIHAGYLPEEVIGKSVDEFYYYIEDRLRLKDALQQHREINDFEIRMKNKLGRLVIVSINTHLNFDEFGNHIGSEGIMRDITERKKAEESIVNLNNELEDLNRQKTKLFSIISHDLRGPMANTISLMDIIDKEFDTFDTDELKEYLDLLKKSTSNAFDLLEGLLLWTRNQFDKIAFVPISLRFSDQLETVLHNLAPTLESKNLMVNTHIPEGLMVVADQDMLKTILRNLISNAIKFSYPGGQIFVEAQRVDKDLRISIKDMGLGIREENLTEIFNKTSSFTTFGTKGEKGSGLGLDLCGDFVEKHGGKIWVESVYEQGSTFSFTIPQPV